MTRKKSVVCIALALVLGTALGVGATLGICGGAIYSTKTYDGGGYYVVGTAVERTTDGLAQWATRAYNEDWGFVFGGSSVGEVDNAGLINSYTGGTDTAEAMLAAAQESGPISTLPEVPGLGLYMPGHVGIYIGGGLCIDARSEAEGIVLSSVSAMGWTDWMFFPAVEKSTDGDDIHPADEITPRTSGEEDGTDGNGSDAGGGSDRTEDSAGIGGGNDLTGTSEIDSASKLAGTVTEDGTPADGWVQTTEGKWQYIKDGAAATGWQSDIPGWEGQWFYFDTNGIMQTGWKNDIPGQEGQWLFFGPAGNQYRSCLTPDGYAVDENGAATEMNDLVAGMSSTDAMRIALGLAQGKNMGTWKTMTADEFLCWWGAVNG